MHCDACKVTQPKGTALVSVSRNGLTSKVCPGCLEGAIAAGHVTEAIVDGTTAAPPAAKKRARAKKTPAAA